MEPAEVQDSLGELEQRLERLRALYEQYFMGIERTEPSVLRKDVERRFWALRRVQIRNTAMRFKFNQVNQRYNTYQQYWQRTMRQIEAGTYRRHLRRAENRFGADAVMLAAGKQHSDQQEQDLKANRQEAEEKAKRALERVPDLDEVDVDVDFGPESVDIDTNELFVSAAPRVPGVVGALDSLDEPEDLGLSAGADAKRTLGGSPTTDAYTSPRGPSRHRHHPNDVASPPAPRQAAPQASALQSAQGFGEIGDVFAKDRRDIKAPRPTIPSPAPRPEHGLGRAPWPSVPPGTAKPGRQAGPAPQKPPQPRAQQDFAGAPRVPSPRPPGHSQTPTPARGAVTHERSGPARPPTAQSPRPLSPAAQQRTMERAAHPNRFSGGNGQPSPRPATKPLVKPAAKPAAKPATAAATAGPKARPTPPSPKANPAATSPGDSGISDSRVRELYRDYVNAKRQCNESTSTITEQSLAKSLRGSAEKLSKKHKGRRIDYEVTIKNGRAVLKPVVKS